MTTLEALEKSILVWAYIAKFNCGKIDAYADLSLKTDYAHCPLCEYTDIWDISCKNGCPVWRKQEKRCLSDKGNYSKWDTVESTHKPIYAKAFLQQLKDKLISYEL